MMKRVFIYDIIDYLLRDLSWGRIVVLTFILAVLPWLVVFSLPDDQLHIYFLNVGQGDSIFVKTPNNYQILIDGGPSNAVLHELGRIMPFYDRSIDLLILTHPHADHMIGLIEVLKRYQIGQVLVNPVAYDSSEYQTFLDLVEGLKIKKSAFLAGDRVQFKDGLEFISFWPRRQGDIFEVLDVNRASMVFSLAYKNFSALFTGDAELGEENPELASFDWKKVNVLKVPHQGSRGAVAEETLPRLQPDLAVILVGRNRFGHPANETLNLLQKLGVRILRTDQEGTIEVVSDGESWFVEQEGL